VSDRSAIEWTDASWNPVTGCSKVSPGCANCYAETLSLRFGRSAKPWTPENAAANVVLHPERLHIPLRWRQGLVYKALALWYLSRQKNAEMATFWGGEYTTLMLRARQAHGPANDRPVIRPRIGGYLEQARRPWSAPSRRLTTGTRWDQMGQ